MHTSVRLLLPCTVVFLLVVNNVFAEIPKLSKEDLLGAASHALSGKVQHTYERKEQKGNYEYTYGVAEISATRVDKGTDISTEDVVYVRYWRKKRTGGGRPEPGHYGHWNVPSEGDSAEIYVKGDRKSGFDVLSPNGFFKVNKPAASKP